MKRLTLLVSALCAIVLITAFAFHIRLGHFPIVGPPAPSLKWQFKTMDPLQPNCTLSGPILGAFASRKCGPPDHLPEHSPAIDADRTIYVGGAKGLYALNPDGTEKWLHENVSNGFNFQAPYQPVLYAFIADDGHIWFDFKNKNEPYGAGMCRVDTNGEGMTCASAVSNVTQTGLLKDGSIFVVWDNTPPAFLNPDGSPQANAGYVPNGETRQEWWDGNFGVPRDCHPPALGSDGTRYVGCKDGFVVMKPSGNDTIWSLPTPGYWASQPAVAQDGTVYFGSDDGHLYAFDPDGKLKWKFATGDKVRSTPAVAKNGTIFFGSDDHYLYAVAADGKAKWEFKTGGPVYSPTIGEDGTVYALSGDGNLYAIQDLEANGGLSGQWTKWAGDIRNTGRPASL